MSKFREKICNEMCEKANITPQQAEIILDLFYYDELERNASLINETCQDPDKAKALGLGDIDRQKIIKSTNNLDTSNLVLAIKNTIGTFTVAA